MFEHLDDPAPWRPDRDAVLRRGRSLRRRRRLVAGGAGTLAGVVLAGIAGTLYVDRRDDAIDRVEVRTPAPSLDGAVNVLLAGLDEPGGRADTVVVLRLASDGSARALFVPRDLWDPVAGARMATIGGPQALVDAVDRTLGVPVDHVVTLDAQGFADLVDELGGLPVAVHTPLRDEPTGLELEPAPCVDLDGDTALALVRARHVDGDPTGDLGRIARSRAVAAAVVQELAAVGADPLELERLSRVLADHAVLDDGLSLDRLVDLGRRLAGAGDVTTDTVPVVPVVIEGAAVLQVAEGADTVLAVYGATGAPVTAPGDPIPVEREPTIGPC